MANPCLECRFAEWRRTKSGRLHPSGDGRCTWQMPEIILPKSRYFVGWRSEMPSPSGGWIERDDDKPCPTFEAK